MRFPCTWIYTTDSVNFYEVFHLLVVSLPLLSTTDRLEVVATAVMGISGIVGAEWTYDLLIFVSCCKFCVFLQWCRRRPPGMIACLISIISKDPLHVDGPRKACRFEGNSS